MLDVHHRSAINAKLGYLEFLEALVDDELHTRDVKGLEKRLRAARFPVTKTLEEFDFAFQRAVDAMQIKSLSSCDFIAKHETALFIGPPGVGKSHLATAIGVKACLRGYDVIFATVQHLASQLNATLADLSVERFIEQYVGADLVILDELGFTPLNKIVADHIFRIVSKRYERGSIIVTSNKPFELWGKMFANRILATAVLDRSSITLTSSRSPARATGRRIGGRLRRPRERPAASPKRARKVGAIRLPQPVPFRLPRAAAVC